VEHLVLERSSLVERLVHGRSSLVKNVSFMDAVNDSIMCIISLNCLLVTRASSSSSGSCCGGCFLGGMVSGIENVAAAG
jgi:hypothetical protein